jgi:membrane associated rhomboid family serine protease
MLTDNHNNNEIISTDTNNSRHGRKLSYVQFGKRAMIQDEYASSNTLMIPFDELKQQQLQTRRYSSTIHITERSIHSSNLEEEEQGEEQPIEKHLDTRLPRSKRFINWLCSTNNIGPFTKEQDNNNHLPIVTYILVAFAIIIFSGQLLQSKESSGEFFELEPFNVMLGPSIEIIIQSGARFPPCMRHVDSMPALDQRYICLHTLSQSLTPTATAIAASNDNNTMYSNSQSFVLLEPVVNLLDPSLLNSSCSLSSICGMTAFHQHGKPDQTYRFLTPLFIHTGIVHLFINMTVLIMLGVKVERTINSLRFSCKYI